MKTEGVKVDSLTDNNCHFVETVYNPNVDFAFITLVTHPTAESEMVTNGFHQILYLLLYLVPTLKKAD